VQYNKQVYKISVLTIETNFHGIDELIKFYGFASQFTYTSVELDLTSVNHIDANLSALIMALAHKLKHNNKNWIFIVFPPHMNVFFRNGLISHLKGEGNLNSYGDNRESAIPLKAFDKEDDDNYCRYLKSEFLGHRGLDYLTKTVKDNLQNHFLEVFINAVQHANPLLPIYACGQYFPEKNILKFTLIDLGCGFLQKISEKTNGSVNDDKTAIIWATDSLNTTKNKAVSGPGGLGLKELKKYCATNNGSFHICSGSGYVNMNGDKTFENNLKIPLQGSLINLIFRNI
jgi:hypothetical protein